MRVDADISTFSDFAEHAFKTGGFHFTIVMLRGLVLVGVFHFYRHKSRHRPLVFGIYIILSKSDGRIWLTYIYQR